MGSQGTKLRPIELQIIEKRKNLRSPLPFSSISVVFYQVHDMSSRQEVAEKLE
jgi:hypothetical protein